MTEQAVSILSHKIRSIQWIFYILNTEFQSAKGLSNQRVKYYASIETQEKCLSLTIQRCSQECFTQTVKLFNPKQIVVICNIAQIIIINILDMLFIIITYQNSETLQFEGDLLTYSPVNYLTLLKMRVNNKKTLIKYFFPKSSLGAHTVHGLSFHLRTLLPNN